MLLASVKFRQGASARPAGSVVLPIVETVSTGTDDGGESRSRVSAVYDRTHILLCIAGTGGHLAGIAHMHR